jgi:hypothetical protein
MPDFNSNLLSPQGLAYRHRRTESGSTSNIHGDAAVWEGAATGIDNVAKRSDEHGIPLAYLKGVAEVAENEDAIIILRASNPHAMYWQERGHPGKPQEVKAKTTDWGPCAGLVPAEPEFSKLNGDPNCDFAKETKKVNECVEAGHAQRMDAVIPQKRIEELCKEKGLFDVKGVIGGPRIEMICKRTEKTSEGETKENEHRFIGELGQDGYAIFHAGPNGEKLRPYPVLGGVVKPTEEEKKAGKPEKCMAYTADIDVGVVLRKRAILGYRDIPKPHHSPTIATTEGDRRIAQWEADATSEDRNKAAEKAREAEKEVTRKPEEEVAKKPEEEVAKKPVEVARMGAAPPPPPLPPTAKLLSSPDIHEEGIFRAVNWDEGGGKAAERSGLTMQKLSSFRQRRSSQFPIDPNEKMDPEGIASKYYKTVIMPKLNKACGRSMNNPLIRHGVAADDPNPNANPEDLIPSVQFAPSEFHKDKVAFVENSQMLLRIFAKAENESGFYVPPHPNWDTKFPEKEYKKPSGFDRGRAKLQRQMSRPANLDLDREPYSIRRYSTAQETPPPMLQESLGSERKFSDALPPFHPAPISEAIPPEQSPQGDFSGMGGWARLRDLPSVEELLISPPPQNRGGSKNQEQRSSSPSPLVPNIQITQPASPQNRDDDEGRGGRKRTRPNDNVASPPPRKKSRSQHRQADDE